MIYARCDACGNATKYTKACSGCGLVRYCSIECQLKCLPIHKFVCCESLKICHAESHRCGARLVARKPFVEGDEIVREKPCSKVSMLGCAQASFETSSKEEAGDIVWENHIAKLPVDSVERSIVLDLSDAWNDPPTVGGIGRTNAIPLGDENDHEGYGLFPIICRANHSCHPNARYIWRHDLQHEILLAIRTIAPGEEVTVCYLDGVYCASYRKDFLKQSFGFICACKLCKEDDPVVDAKLHKICEIDNDIPSVASMRPQRAIKMAEDALELLAEVNMNSAFWTKRLMHDLHQIHAKIGNNKAATRWYTRATQASKVCEGGNDPKGVAKLPNHV